MGLISHHGREVVACDKRDGRGENFFQVTGKAEGIDLSKRIFLGMPEVLDGDIFQEIKKGPLKGLLLRAMGEGTFSFKSRSGLYLCAERNTEKVEASRSHCREWETFRWMESPAVDYLQSKISGIVTKDRALGDDQNSLPLGSNLIRVEFFSSPKSVLKIYVPERIDDYPKPRLERVAKSIQYIDFLVNNFILRGDCFWRLLKQGAIKKNEVYSFILQCSDQGFPLENSCAYDARVDNELVSLIPDLHFFLSKGYGDFFQCSMLVKKEWREKKSIAFWRGSTTGLSDLNSKSITELSRYKLCDISAKNEDVIDAKITDLVQLSKKSDFSEIFCQLENAKVIGGRVRQLDFCHYKYQVEIDGNVTPWGLLKKMMMGSCVLRVESKRTQWFYGDIQPWVHYVPVKEDMSDLIEKIFWCKDNDDQAKHIAENAENFARSMSFSDQMEFAAEQIINSSIVGGGKSEVDL